MAAVLTLVMTKQIRIYINETIQKKHSTNNTKHSKYKHTLPKHPQITKPTHTHTHPHVTKQVKTTTAQDKTQ